MADLMPPRRPRLSCRSITGLQMLTLVTLLTLTGFVLTLVVLGSPLWGALLTAVTLVALSCGAVSPRVARLLLGGHVEGEGLPA